MLKRGAMGCIVYDGADLRRSRGRHRRQGLSDRGLQRARRRRRLHVRPAARLARRRELATAATWANACGAFAVSRLLCAPEYPTFEELQFFLKHGSKHHALRKDEAINHIHWATTRRRDIPSLMAFAFDHRVQLEEIAARAGADADKDRGLQGAGGEGRGQGRQRPRRLRHAARREIRPRGDVRIRQARFLLARPAGRAAGLAAAALRVQPGHRLAARRLAGRPLHQVPVLLSPGRSRRR